MLKINNLKVEVLTSDKHFESWVLDQYDISVLSAESIRTFLDEEKPAVYPCIPVTLDDGTSITYVEISLIEYWYEKIYK